MSEEPIFSDRLIPLLALPGLLLSGALVILDILNGKAATSIWFWLILTIMLGLFSLVILTIPLYIIAKFQLFRSIGLTRAKAIGAMVLGLCAFIALGVVYQVIGKLFEWLFAGSHFYLLAGSAFVLFLLIYYPYSLYCERKERSKLNLLDNTPIRRSKIVRK